MNTAEIINKMSRLVNRTVKHYKTDFTDYDIKTIEKAESEKAASFLWILRECGTFLLSYDQETGKINDPDLLRAIRDTWPVRKEYTVKYKAGTWTIKKAA